MRIAVTLLVFGAGLCGGRAWAEPMELPAADYPVIAEAAANAEGFAPAGWAVESRAEGDLNGDALPDLALILRGQNAALVLANSGMGEEHVDSNPRIVVVALAQAGGGYRLAAANHALIPRMDDPVLQDFLEGGGITIARGVLRVQLGLWYSSGSWESSTYSYTFRWQHERFELIGYDSSRQWRNSGEVVEVSVNYSTRFVVVSRGRMDGDMRAARPFRIPPRPAVGLEAMGDGIQFDPGVNVG